MHLSMSFASPIVLGGLATSDPLDPDVRAWWADAVARVYEAIPDFGGFVVKADSEGQPGPFAYGRDHADGANLLARALANLLDNAAHHGGGAKHVVIRNGGDRVAFVGVRLLPNP